MKRKKNKITLISTTVLGYTTDALSVDDLYRTMLEFTKNPLVTKIETKSRRYFFSGVKVEKKVNKVPDPIGNLFGIEILQNKALPKNVIKIIYSNGKKEYYEISNGFRQLDKRLVEC